MRKFENILTRFFFNKMLMFFFESFSVKVYYMLQGFHDSSFWTENTEFGDKKSIS